MAMLRLCDTTIESHAYQAEKNRASLRRYYQRMMLENAEYEIQPPHRHLFPELFSDRFVLISTETQRSWDGNRWVDGLEGAVEYLGREVPRVRATDDAPRDARWVNVNDLAELKPLDSRDVCLARIEVFSTKYEREFEHPLFRGENDQLLLVLGYRFEREPVCDLYLAWVSSDRGMGDPIPVTIGYKASQTLLFIRGAVNCYAVDVELEESQEVRAMVSLTQEVSEKIRRLIGDDA